MLFEKLTRACFIQIALETISEFLNSDRLKAVCEFFSKYSAKKMKYSAEKRNTVQIS
jgi:hypothetical protein